MSYQSPPASGQFQGATPAATAPEGAVRSGRALAGRGLVALVARIVVATTVGAVAVVVLWWFATGGRWENVQTPSMGTYAPVGTLLWVKPTKIADLRVGDVITFHPPALGAGTGGRTNASLREPTATYTHRVVAIDPDHTVQTKGDLNGGRDPWRIDQAHLVGKVEARVPVAGWVLKALPVLGPGLLACFALTLFAPVGSRAPLRVVGAALVIAAAIYVYNPLFGAEQLGFVPLGSPGARATYVSEGLLPVELEAPGARPVRIGSGQEASIVTPKPNAHGRFQVHVVPTVPPQVWVIIVAAALAPAAWSAIVGVEPPPPRRRKQSKRGQPKPEPVPSG